MSASFGDRALSAAGLTSLALLAAALIVFPAFPKAGLDLLARETITVNRTLKGDRLPVRLRPAPPPHESVSSPVQPRSQARIPVGCDAAFSPIAAPRLTDVLRRCTV